tara:strand:- start:1700 stop:1918 length:219 start_codon:yes stop_codon:yes gene_type:complete
MKTFNQMIHQVLGNRSLMLHEIYSEYINLRLELGMDMVSHETMARMIRNDSSIETVPFITASGKKLFKRRIK